MIIGRSNGIIAASIQESAEKKKSPSVVVMVMSITFEEPGHRPVETHRDANRNTGDAVELRNVDPRSGPEGNRRGRRGTDVPELVPAEDFRTVVVPEGSDDAVDQDIPDQAGDRGWPGVFVVHRLVVVKRFEADENTGRAAAG